MRKFHARPYKFYNGAVGWHLLDRPGLEPYARVQNCPIEGTGLRYTCYATGPRDGAQIPAKVIIYDKNITGFFTMGGDPGPVFVPDYKHRAFLTELDEVRRKKGR